MMNNTTETIKQKLPIETVVGSYVKLEKAGRNFRACCPFHNEKTPSFYVTVDKGIFYCYGCHKGGDIFSFVEAIEGISFIEAKKILAEKAGVPLDDYRPGDEKPSRLAILREIMDSAAKHYEVGLRTNPAIVEYLLSRGLTKETMVTFRIGYAEKGWSNLYDFLKRRTTTLTPNKKYSDEDILATGLCIKSDKNNGLYDRFRERIMFPIMDSQGRVIAFTGRVVPGTDEANRPVGKYINSPETDLYHKSSVLFGLDKTKTEIHSHDCAIIVEGQMDLIMSYQAGVRNVVALSGTASTDEHMTQIKRFTNTIAICLDSDNAGLVAAQKTVLVAYRHDMRVSVIGITGGKDPADIVQADPELWKQATMNRKDFITFRLDHLRASDHAGDKVRIAQEELFPVLVQMRHRMIIDEKIQEIAHAFHVSADALRRDFEVYLKNHESALPMPDVQKKQNDEGIRDHETMARMKLLGILMMLQGQESFAELEKKFKEHTGELYATIIAEVPLDIKARLQTETGQALGELPKQLPVYEKAFDHTLMQYALARIEKQKKILDQELIEHPDDPIILAQVHELAQKRDAIIHQTHH